MTTILQVLLGSAILKYFLILQIEEPSVIEIVIKSVTMAMIESERESENTCAWKIAWGWSGGRALCRECCFSIIVIESVSVVVIETVSVVVIESESESESEISHMCMKDSSGVVRRLNSL